MYITLHNQNSDKSIRCLLYRKNYELSVFSLFLFLRKQFYEHNCSVDIGESNTWYGNFGKNIENIKVCVPPIRIYTPSNEPILPV